MGAADVVPGVSGGTIAFISGIYEELVGTIDGLNSKIFTHLKTKGWKATFEAYNLRFLLTLFLGVLTSVLSLAKVVSFMLEHYPILLWSFFFGLVLASIVYIGRQITSWSVKSIALLLLGLVIAYYVTIATPAQASDTWYMFFISGCIAIIAMILPGISGSFILVLLGTYTLVLNTLTTTYEAILQKNWEVMVQNVGRIALFMIGCLIGLKLFSKVLKWMFTHHKQLILALLTGFMIGSLNRIWPWKQVLSTRMDRHGELVPLESQSILPSAYEGDPQLLTAIFMAIAGFALIFIIERAARTKPE